MSATVSPGYVFDAAGNGRIWEDATPEVLAAVHQTWLCDPASGNYLLDVFREPHDGDTGSVDAMRGSGFRTAASSTTPRTASRYWRPNWSCCSRPSTHAERIKHTSTRLSHI